ncbi:hypothetical protein, partial [Dysgonomonas capnocytophagoides]|uniref:hypothetical protein n=1 Tax=Dysgonomonas capnocytophagoides TaxID=45254 RepID=UPI002A7FF823
NPLLVYIPTGDIFILAKRVKHILVHGVNLDWHEGATLTGFSSYTGGGTMWGPVAASAAADLTKDRLIDIYHYLTFSIVE